MTAEAMLQKVRTDGASRALAQVLVAHALDRRVSDDLDAGRVLALCRAVAKGWDDERLEVFVREELVMAAERARGLAGSLGAQVPGPMIGAASQVLERGVKLSPDLVRRLLDHPETRALTQDVLQVVLSDFVRKAQSTLSDSRLVGGVVSAARGFMNRGVTGTLLSAVGEGLNAEAERRIRDFLDEAVGAALARMVHQICDERHERAYGALRAGMLRAALGAEVGAWTEQVMAMDPAGGALVFVRAARRMVETEDFARWLREHLPLWTGRPGETWGALLERAGLGQVREAVVDIVAAEVAGVLATDAFAQWWHAVQEGTVVAQVPAPAPKRPARTRKKKGPA